MTTSQIFLTCLNEANAFLKSAEWSREKYEDNIFELAYASVYAVNLSFSCELYLKSIYIYYNNTNSAPREHGLKKLFANLSDEVRKEISQNYTQTSHELSLEDLLEEQNDIFISWRYQYEERTGEMSFHYRDLYVFATCLKKFCNNLRSKL